MHACKAKLGNNYEKYILFSIPLVLKASYKIPHIFKMKAPDIPEILQKHDVENFELLLGRSCHSYVRLPFFWQQQNFAT